MLNYLIYVFLSTTEVTPTNPDGIYNDNGYDNTYYHLLQKFIYGILGITRISKATNHPMNDVTYGHVILALNRLQMFLILNGGTK